MNNTTDNRNALPINYRLENYQIQNILGDGGFGITYLAKDTQLNILVAIKEYFPSELTVRETQNYTVQPKSKKEVDNFAYGLERFLKEAQTIAQFKHHNIVRVLRFFQALNTAYIVMEYERGENLACFLKKGKTATQEELMAFLPGLLEGLETVHNAGYLHRDIKPANIYLRQTDHSPLLIDFGAARYDLGSRSRSITTIVTPGYAPFEQYQSEGSQQGAWTDIYSTAAVLYRFISGKVPIESTKRVAAMMRNKPDPLTPAVQIGQGQYSESFLKAIDWALKINEQKRPQNVGEWREKLLGFKPLEEKLEPHQEKSFLNEDEALLSEQDLDLWHEQISELDSLEIEKLSIQPTRAVSKSVTSHPKSPNKWLRRFAVLVAVIILFAFFIGGNWLYHQITLEKLRRAVAENDYFQNERSSHTPFPTMEKSIPFMSPPVKVETPTPREVETPTPREEVETPSPIETKKERERELRENAKERAIAAQARLPTKVPLRIMTGAGVRLRLLPKKRSKRGTLLTIGTILFELESTRKNGEIWYRVETYDYDMGWVYGGYTLPLEPEKRAQAYIEVANRKLNNNRSSFGDLVELCNFIKRASNEVELESAVELKWLYLLALQRSLDKIPSYQQHEERYANWIDELRMDIVYKPTEKRFFIKKERFQELHDKYSFLPIAARLLNSLRD
jgi:serine/threonine protein kinase